MIAPDEPTLANKVEFLSRPEAYSHAIGELVRKETHMSWVFLVGDRVYKLKKPVRFPYLDFSTLARREAACRAEFSLNRRLAPNVYIAVIPLIASPQGLSLGGEGHVIDWLVLMRRLDDRWALKQVVRDRRLEASQLDRLVTTRVRFYRRARPILLSAGAHLAAWPRNLTLNRRVLLDPRFDLPSGLIRRIDRTQARTSADPAMNSPCVTRAITRRAPALRAALAARSRVPPRADQIIHDERRAYRHIRDVSRCHGVVGLGSAILARVAQIRHHGRDAHGSGILIDPAR